MTEQAKAKLQIAKATDTQIDAAEKQCVKLAKDFIATKPWAAKAWDQATHARFLGYVLGLEAEVPKDAKRDVPSNLADSEFASLEAVDRAIFLLRAGNASQFRQILEKASVLAKAEDLTEYN